MSKHIWGDLLTEKGCLIVPRDLRLKRKELGLNNQEYILLLDYLDHFKHGEVENLYQTLAELNSISRRQYKRDLVLLKRRGFFAVKYRPIRTAE